ncbi:MAG: COGs COG3558, partial [uncultured Rubrobacteraceae bacterium]
AADRREPGCQAPGTPVRRGDRGAEGQGRPGRLELPRPREGVDGLHGGLPMAQPRRVLCGAGGDQGFPRAQVGQGARLPAPEEPLVLYREPHSGKVRVREPGRERAVVAQPPL